MLCHWQLEAIASLVIWYYHPCAIRQKTLQLFSDCIIGHCCATPLEHAKSSTAWFQVARKLARKLEHAKGSCTNVRTGCGATE
jgi:hypothetical protein